jgi:hypothetical protein
MPVKFITSSLLPVLGCAITDYSSQVPLLSLQLSNIRASTVVSLFFHVKQQCWKMYSDVYCEDGKHNFTGQFLLQKISDNRLMIKFTSKQKRLSTHVRQSNEIINE